MRVAVVTPYAGEPPEMLRAAHESICAQSVPVTHFMVADGAPCPAVDGWAAEHIVLGRPHRDGGCTPRAIAAIDAFAQGYDAVAFLDADNRFRPDHIASLVETAQRTAAHLVFSDRAIVLADGTPCPFEDLDVVERRHADTSCHFLTSQAAFLAGSWAALGPRLWPLCDRVVLTVARRRGLRLAWTGRRTLVYTSRWGLHYRALGRTPPADEHRLDWEAVRNAPVPPDGPWLIAADIAAALGSEHAGVDADDPDIGSRIVPLPVA
jgi:hypothetical protein